MIHDHWPAYLSYACKHAFCNAHYIRELTWAFEEDKQKWAGEMRALLEEMNGVVHDAGGSLASEIADPWIKRYTEIIQHGERECPLRVAEEPLPGSLKKIPGILLSPYSETETLRFLTDPCVPFTNNAAEQSIRMEKVKQKISGCYRSIKCAKDFALIRSYLLSCAKHQVSASEALHLLFSGKWPEFIIKNLLTR